jgi:hypothetical protein
LRHCATNRQVAGSIPNDVSGFFHDFLIGIILSADWGQKWVPGIFPGRGGGVKAAGAYGWYCMAIVEKSGSLDLLAPCGPVQACNGTAFHLFFTYLNIYVTEYCSSLGGGALQSDT